MQYKDIKVGDKLRLVAGGPIMAVEEVRHGTGFHEAHWGIHCQWFAGKKLEHGTFPPESLEKVTDEKKN